VGDLINIAEFQMHIVRYPFLFTIFRKRRKRLQDIYSVLTEKPQNDCHYSPLATKNKKKHRKIPEHMIDIQSATDGISQRVKSVQ